VTLEDDFARRLTTALDQGLGEIDASTSHRLALIRRQAVTRDSGTYRGNDVLTWAHRHARVSAFLVLALLLASLWLMQSYPRTYSAETDILLLTGDLPPDVYANKSFSQWLEERAIF
jgi:multidrug efflux pump subunit AcrB